MYSNSPHLLWTNYLFKKLSHTTWCFGANQYSCQVDATVRFCFILSAVNCELKMTALVFSLIVLFAFCSKTISEVQVDMFTQGISKFSSDVFQVIILQHIQWGTALIVFIEKNNFNLCTLMDLWLEFEPFFCILFLSINILFEFPNINSNAFVLKLERKI